MITYLDDLDAVRANLARITAHLDRGLTIAPGEAGCLMDAERALRECADSMDAG